MTRSSAALRLLPRADEMSRHAGPAAAFLKALANPHRLQVLCVLADGEMSVSALNERIPLSQSALSQHLAVLREDGLVSTRRESQTIYYRVAPGPALDVIHVLHQHFCRPAGRDRRSATRRSHARTGNRRQP